MKVDLWTEGMKRHITDIEVPEMKPLPTLLIWRRPTHPTRYFLLSVCAMNSAYCEIDYLQFSTPAPDPHVCTLPAHAQIKHEGEE